MPGKNFFQKEKKFQLSTVSSFPIHSVSSAAAFRSIFGFFPLLWAAGLVGSGGTLDAHRGHRGSASAMSTYVRQDGHADARMAGFAGGDAVLEGGERLRFPREGHDEEVDADEEDEVSGERADRAAAARCRASRTMSRVQTAAHVVTAAAGAVDAVGGRLRSWWPSWAAWWR